MNPIMIRNLHITDEHWVKIYSYSMHLKGNFYLVFSNRLYETFHQKQISKNTLQSYGSTKNV